MSSTCSYFDLYDPESESVTEWGRRILEAFTDEYKGINFHQAVSNPLDQFCEQYDVRPEDLDLPTHVIKVLMVAQSDQNLPSQCPHDVHPEASCCIFHLSEEERDALDIPAERIQRRLTNYLKTDSVGESPSHRERDKEPRKCLVGATLADLHLNLDYKILDPPHNYPIDMRFLQAKTLTFTQSTVRSPLRLDHLSCDSVDFEGAEFQNQLTITEAIIDGERLKASNARFEGGLSLKNSIVTVERMDFDDSVFQGQETSFKGGTFVTPTISFKSAAFASQVSDFSQGTFVSSTEARAEIDFSRSHFTGKHVAFQSFQIGYNHTEGASGPLLGDGPSFDPSQFGLTEDHTANVDFTGVRIEAKRFSLGGDLHGSFKFTQAHVAVQKFDMSPLHIEGELPTDTVDFSESEFDCHTIKIQNFQIDLPGQRTRIKFEDLRVAGRVFEFGGSEDATLTADEISFENASFTSNHVTFKALEVGTHEAPASLLFDDASFDCTSVDFDSLILRCELVSFESCDFGDSTVTFGDLTTATDIDCTKAVIRDGGIHRTTDDEFVFDLTRATLGDVALQPRTDATLLENFHFRRTTFDGFQFSEHTEPLTVSNWYLHTTDIVERETGQTLREEIRKLLPLLRLTSPPDGNYEAMEDTYRRAKNGADSVGDAKATSAFFQLELGYRRLQHRDRASETNSWLHKVKYYGRYTANLGLLALTGYGEKPLWTGVVSVLLIAVFALAFEFIWVLSGSPGGGFTGALGGLVLSVQSFTSLTVVSGEIHSGLVVALAYLEGFTGPFMVALLVFALTRSIRR